MTVGKSVKLCAEVWPLSSNVAGCILCALVSHVKLDAFLSSKNHKPATTGKVFSVMI